jgi:hypothetical protein
MKPVREPDWDKLTDTELKVVENRLRRSAQRQGYLLRKSPRRDTRAFDYGLYAILDARTNGLTHASLAGSSFSLTIGDAWRSLLGDEEEAAA